MNRAISEDLRFSQAINRFVPEKTVEFLKKIQGKGTKKWMKLRILGKEFELRDQDKNFFIKKLKGNLEFLNVEVLKFSFFGYGWFLDMIKVFETAKLGVPVECKKLALTHVAAYFFPLHGNICHLLFWAGIVETIICAFYSMMSCGGVPAECICSSVINDVVELSSHAIQWNNCYEFDYTLIERAKQQKQGVKNGVVAEVWGVARTCWWTGGGECMCFASKAYKRELISALPRCDGLRRAVNSPDWEPVFILYFRRSISEDLSLAREIKALCVGLTVVINERENFVDELNVLVLIAGWISKMSTTVNSPDPFRAEGVKWI
nr:hypothetical protein [Tanacetum cinerariifolium]